MTILITGVAGLLGSRFAQWLLDNTGHKVVGIDNLSGGYSEYIPKGVDFNNFDCINQNNIGWVFRHYKPAIVYHFAAYAAEGLSPFIRMFNYENNLVATANIVNQCIKHKVDRLVFTSSMAVYGNGKSPFDESDSMAPIDPYGIAKMGCEMDIKIAGEQHGLDWCIVRPHNVFGPGQNIWDRYRNVLGIWMRQCIRGENITVFGDGEQIRAFTYIDNILRPLYLAGTSAKASNEIINLGGINYSTILMAAKIVAEVANAEALIELLGGRHEVRLAYSTYRKSVDILEYREDVSFEDGIEKMWKWARNQPARKVKDMPYEIEDKLYKFWE